MASEGLHEAADQLDESTIDNHRAVTSLIEEFEAVDWYEQRVNMAVIAAGKLHDQAPARVSPR